MAIPLFTILSLVIWAYGLYCTYNEVQMANGETNPNIFEDWKRWDNPKKIFSLIAVLIIIMIVVSGAIGALSPKNDDVKTDTSYTSDYSSPSYSDDYTSGSDDKYSSSSDGHDVSSHYEGEYGSSDTHGTVYDDGSVESHQTGHTKYGDYEIDSYMDSDGNIHGSVKTGGRTYNV